MRKLKAEEIECRISQCFDGKCTALLYKTARVDRAILDEVYGTKWQNDFKVIDGKMYGGIGIYDSDIKEWLWRWDCGTESNTEAEKGQASDCFKRAGFKWGIGIELYSAPQIWLNIPTKKNEKGKWEPVDKYNKYDVTEIGYDENGNINKLEIVDKNKTVLFTFGKKRPPQNKPIEKPKEIDPDLDLVEGAKACASYKELEKYYKENFPNVVNKKSFNELIEELKGKFAYKEAAEIY